MSISISTFYANGANHYAAVVFDENGAATLELFGTPMTDGGGLSAGHPYPISEEMAATLVAEFQDEDRESPTLWNFVKELGYRK